MSSVFFRKYQRSAARQVKDAKTSGFFRFEKVLKK